MGKLKLQTTSTKDLFISVKLASAMTGCITRGNLLTGKTLDTGCPRHIQFCHDTEVNPTLSDTWIASVFLAEKGELGTGYVAIDHEKKVVICAFRSSTTREDWISDFEITPTKYKPSCYKEYKKLIKKGVIKECTDCFIHYGFSKFTKTLGKKFLRMIENILNEYPEYKIVVTGHSLGAALASITGIELKLASRI